MSPTLPPFPMLPAQALQRLGERVALSRKARGLTQRDLAHVAGVGASSVVALEKGHPGVALGTLARALEALELLGELDGLLRPQHDPALADYAVSRLGRKP